MILTASATPYIGRFAPSPTGPLHLGSLYTALASFLDARHRQGRWLLRIDDLDTPRNMPGAASAIIDCLRRFGLQWDGEVYYQREHLEDYSSAITRLHDQQRLYRCICSRKRLANCSERYPGFCRDANHSDREDYALRVKTDDEVLRFEDLIQGPVIESLRSQHGDFIIKRKDGVVAYQLAVVVDDHLQGVNHVVRGYDLLDSTSRQVYLHQLLGYTVPAYMHVPVIVDAEGNKLSKQTYAQAVNESHRSETLFLLLDWLKQNPPESLRRATVAEILDWAVVHWQPARLTAIHRIQSAAESNADDSPAL